MGDKDLVEKIKNKFLELSNERKVYRYNPNTFLIELFDPPLHKHTISLEKEHPHPTEVSTEVRYVVTAYRNDVPTYSIEDESFKEVFEKLNENEVREILNQYL